MSWPAVQHPAAILHGSGDDVVPLAYSQRVVGAHPHVHLEVVDDDHRLSESYEAMGRLIRSIA